MSKDTTIKVKLSAKEITKYFGPIYHYHEVYEDPRRRRLRRLNCRAWKRFEKGKYQTVEIPKKLRREIARCLK